MKVYIVCLLLTLNLLATDSTNPYELMICDYVKFELLKVDKSGKVSWRHKPAGRVWDFVIKGENLIYPIITKPHEVRCLSFDKKLKWQWPYRKEYREIINLTSFQDGLVISGQRPSEAIFMNDIGTVQSKLDIQTDFHSHHGELGNVYSLQNGNFLAQLWGEGSVVEIDDNGKEIWRYKVPKSGEGKYPEGCVQDVLRLPNCNTLIACGTQARILEITPDKKIVWQLAKDDYPELNLTNACGLQLLKDGSILVTNFLRGNTGKRAHAFVLSKDRKVIWTFNDHKNVKAASRIFAVE